MTHSPAVSADVVCVTFGSAAVIADALRAAPPVGSGRRIVVDHGGDGSADLAEALGATVVRDPTNPGFGAGQNRGVKLGEADYVLLLNPDCTMAPGAVEAGLLYLSSAPDVAAVQGVIANTATGQAERSQGQELGAAHLWGRSLGLRRLQRVPLARPVARRIGWLADHVDREPAVPTDVESLAATALLVRRDAFEQIGGFDSTYFLYGEDLDLCRRLRSSGWRLVALPQRWALHISGASSDGVVPRELVWWEGTMLFAARWWRAGQFASAIGAAALRSVTLYALAPVQSRGAFRRLVGSPVRTYLRRARGRDSSDDLEHPLEGDP